MREDVGYTDGGNSEKGVYLVTGVGPDRPSVGGSVALSLAERGNHVITVGRRSGIFLDGGKRFDTSVLSNIHQATADLSTPEGLDAAYGQIAMYRRTLGVPLSGVGFMCGTGYLDGQVDEDPSLREKMKMLNVTGPELLANRLYWDRHLKEGAPVAAMDGLFAAPNIRALVKKGTQEFVKAKDEMNAALRRWTKMSDMPYLPFSIGDVRGPMLEETIHRRDAQLGWYTGLPEDQYAKGGIGDQVAEGLMRPELYAGTEGPLYLGRAADLAKVPEGRLRVVLPFLVAAKAPAVCKAFGITREQFEKTVRYHRGEQTHGDEFRYWVCNLTAPFIPETYEGR